MAKEKLEKEEEYKYFFSKPKDSIDCQNGTHILSRTLDGTRYE